MGKNEGMWIKTLLFSMMMLITAQFSHAAQLFGAAETGYADLSYFPKWTGMLEREESGAIGTQDTRGRAGRCRPNPRFLCPAQEWAAFVTSPEVMSLGSVELLRRVNTHINKSKYILDPINWGVPDFWAHLGEFFDRSGDCEDYAISKYATLKRLGIPTDKMRIVVLEDLNLDLAHAVLVVELEGTTYVLDNQVSAVLRDSVIFHYKPVYSINEHGWWMHRAAPTP